MGKYQNLIKKFIDRGYEIRPIDAGPVKVNGVLYLRHDIDFDCIFALKMAEVEAEIGVSSSYFFMVSSDSYNLFSETNSSCVRKIIDLGHKVSLHFDPTCYDDIETGFYTESQAFESHFDEKVDFITLHRPNEFFLSCDQKICNVPHSYQSEYQKKIKYISDSQGKFRFGAPEETDSFSNLESIHLLIHPIWWAVDGFDPQDQIDRFILMRISRFQSHIERNCKSYSKLDSGVFKK